MAKSIPLGWAFVVCAVFFPNNSCVSFKRVSFWNGNPDKTLHLLDFSAEDRKTRTLHLCEIYARIENKSLLWNQQMCENQLTNRSIDRCVSDITWCTARNPTCRPRDGRCICRLWFTCAVNRMLCPAAYQHFAPSYVGETLTTTVDDGGYHFLVTRV